MDVTYCVVVIFRRIGSFSSSISLMADGTFSTFPSTIGLIKFNPCFSSIFSPFVDKINVVNDVAPHFHMIR